MIKKNIFLLLPLLVILLVSGCSDSTVSPPETVYSLPNSNSDLTFVNPQRLDSSGFNSLFPQLVDYPEGFDYRNLGEIIMKSLKDSLPEGYLPGLWYSKITYTSVGNDGQPRQLSGLIMYPYRVSQPFHQYNVPIISFNHATQPLRELAPSRWGITEDQSKFAEVLIAAGLALKNQWMIIMPDYQGMGDDVSELHPFCNKNLLGKAIADLCAKTIAYLGSKDNNTNCIWNNKLFLMGFSEGGFTTMAGLRELETRGTNVSGAVCLNGPYDLTGTMLPLMLNGQPFPVPYFLPYMILGYNAVPANGTSFSPDVAIKDQYRADLIKVMDGNHSGTEIQAKMPSSKILREIFTPAFIDSLNNPNSSQFKILYENNTWINWTPKTKMFVAHGMNDDCVTYGNYLTFKANHNAVNIRYFELGETFPMLGSYHESFAPWAFLQGQCWIESQM